MYSFGRVHTNNPFYGGFVKESRNYGAMKKFKKSKIIVIEIEIDENKYIEIKQDLEEMFANKEKYHYNYKGLFLAILKKPSKRENYFYCSEFVRFMIEKHKLAKNLKFSEITTPMEFASKPLGKIVYCGTLERFPDQYAELLESQPFKNNYEFFDAQKWEYKKLKS